MLVPGVDTVGHKEQRINYRRYEDRRVALMLSLHEILFEDHAGFKRNRLILEAIMNNFGTDRAAQP